MKKKIVNGNGDIFFIDNNKAEKTLSELINGSAKKIIVPKGVTELKKYIFSNMDNLEEVELPEGLVKIGTRSFGGSRKLAVINIPKSVKTIDTYAFDNCSKFLNVVIPENVEEIGIYAFNRATNITILAPIFMAKTYTQTSNLRNIFSYIPKITIDGEVKKIGDYAFYNFTVVSEVNLNSPLEEIGVSAFSGATRLTKIILPDTVKKIGVSAFSGDTGITNFHLSENIEEIGDSAFNNLKIEIYNSTGYYFCPTTKSGEVTINEGIKKICYRAFYNCKSVTNIILPSTLETIENDAFDTASNLETITIPSNVKTLGSSVFMSSGIKTLVIPNTVKNIGSMLCHSCRSLTQITLPSNIKVIPTQLIGYCVALTEFTIPASVESMEGYIFQGATGLTTVNVNAVNPPVCVAKTFTDLASATKFYVPAASLEAYKSANYWSTLADRIFAQS